MKRITEGSNTPWGRADYVKTDEATGIASVETPSHGGLYVPIELASRIPFPWREYARKWARSSLWYEEDVAWTIVLLVFPDAVRRLDGPHFAANLETARAILKAGYLPVVPGYNLPPADPAPTLFEATP